MLKLKYLEDINQLVKETRTIEKIIKVCLCKISADEKYENTHYGVLK